MCSSTKKIPAAPEWRAAVKQYAKPSVKHSVWQMVNSILPYLALWVGIVYFASEHFWISACLAALAGLLVVRIFIIFHDCGHYNYFKSKKVCKVVGYFTGLICFTPFHDWGKDHKLHHATCGNLDKRGFGDVWTLTLDEYKAADTWTKIKYRMYRHPAIIFFIGPILVFTIKQRFVREHTGKEGRMSVYLCNLGLALYCTGMILLMGFWPFFWLQLIVIGLAAVLGVWLFYVQHQFEETYWEVQENWTFVESALEGSSFYKLPKLLQWFSGNIGFHHIHHLSAKIPNYSLEKAYLDEQIFQEIEPLTILRSLKLFNFRLWDKENRRMVGYKALKA